MGTTYEPLGLDVLNLQPVMKEAACRERPGLPWVPDAYSGQKMPHKLVREIAEMRTICGSCAHLVECRDYALADASIYGVWGGLTSHDRREIRMGRKRVAYNGVGVVADV